MEGQCQCFRGWTGQDCLTVHCAHNPCSGHGECKKKHRCHCHAGYTGAYCESAVPSFRYPLWDSVLPNSQPEYSSLDPYGDAHPVFNMSAISTMRLTVNETLFSGYLLYPPNLYNASYGDAQMEFYNEAVHINIPMKFRVKGQSTRTNIKKAYDLKFEKGKRFFGLDRVAIKCGNGSGPQDDSIMKMFLETQFLRGVNAPVSRTAWMNLYINERYYGLYYFEETGDQNEFLKSRFGTDGGNLMKLHWHVPLHYLGDDPNTYLSVVEHVFDNNTTPYYEQPIGNGNITDFIDLVRFLNKSMTAPVDSYINVDVMLRYLVVESFLRQDDNYVDG